MAQATGPVLVVDDNAASRRFVALILTRVGFTVVTATDGEEGLTLARDHRPCVILLNLTMPGLDGGSFREAQLQSSELAGIPVILISELGEASQIPGRLGAIPAVAKRIEVDELLEQVVTHCESPPA